MSKDYSEYQKGMLYTIDIIKSIITVHSPLTSKYHEFMSTKDSIVNAIMAHIGPPAAEENVDVDKKLKDLSKVLSLISQGYFIKSSDDKYVILENPKFMPDNGEDPFVVYESKYKENK